MNWKEFFKPTILKVILLIAFIILSPMVLAMFGLNQFCDGGPCPEGFPFEFTYFPGSASSDGITETSWGFELKSFWGLIGNLIFWYLVVCLIVFGLGKLRKK